MGQNYRGGYQIIDLTPFAKTGKISEESFNDLLKLYDVYKSSKKTIKFVIGNRTFENLTMTRFIDDAEGYIYVTISLNGVEILNSNSEEYRSEFYDRILYIKTNVIINDDENGIRIECTMYLTQEEIDEMSKGNNPFTNNQILKLFNSTLLNENNGTFIPTKLVTNTHTLEDNIGNSYMLDATYYFNF